MILIEVRNQVQRREFLNLPKRLFRKDPNWISPLDNDVEAVFDPEKNIFFTHGVCTCWLKNIDSQKDSPINQIRRKIQNKGGDRDMIIETYLEEIKNDLMQKMDGDTQSERSDASMASASQIQEEYQDAKNPDDKQEELSVEDIFEILKSTLKNKGKGKMILEILETTVTNNDSHDENNSCQ